MTPFPWYIAGAAVLVLVLDQPAPSGTQSAESPFADFRDVAASAGLTAHTEIGEPRTKTYILETTGGGAAVLDYDSDGWPDIFLVNGARLATPTSSESTFPSRLYRNNGDGTFADVTARAGVAGKGWGQGVAAADYDNDGHVDLFVTYYGHQVLYRNHGDGTFRDVTRQSGLALSNPRWNTGAAFLDADRDGHLDLFVSAYVAYDDATRYAPGAGKNCFWKGLPVMCGPHGLEGSRNALYRGNGDGTFTDVSARAGLLDARPAYGFTPIVLDYDNDGWPDVYVANDSTASLLFRNNRDGTFTELGLRAGVALSGDGRAQAGMGVSVADYDRDGWLDIVKTNFDDDTPSLYRNLGSGMFDDVTFPAGLGVNTRYLGWGTGFMDVDLDGWPDLFIVNGHVYPEVERIPGYRYEQRKLLYRNLGNGRFADVSEQGGPGVLAAHASRGAAFGDLFNTGRQDIVINNTHAAPALLHDCAPRTEHSLLVKLVGTRSNRSAIGARVTIHVAGRRLVDEVRSGGSFCSQNDLRIHAGLGGASRVERIDVRWPDGRIEETGPVDADQLVVIQEGSGVVSRQPFTGRRPRACE